MNITKLTNAVISIFAILILFPISESFSDNSTKLTDMLLSGRPLRGTLEKGEAKVFDWQGSPEAAKGAEPKETIDFSGADWKLVSKDLGQSFGGKILILTLTGAIIENAFTKDEVKVVFHENVEETLENSVGSGETIVLQSEGVVESGIGCGIMGYGKFYLNLIKDDDKGIQIAAELNYVERYVAYDPEEWMKPDHGTDMHYSAKFVISNKNLCKE